MLRHFLTGWWTPAVAGLALLASAPPVQAQGNAQAQRQTQARGQGQALTLPSAELLRLSADAPQEVRAGQQFSYRVTISNQSDSIALHNVKIEQKPGSGVSIDSAKMQSQQQQGRQQQQQQQQQQQGQQKQQDQKQQDQKQQDQQQDQKQQDPKQQDQKQQDQKQQDQKQQAQKSQGQQSKNSWTIDELKPGESRTIEVQATANQQGRADTCFMVTSYTPALCVTTEVVKPQLELTKNAPEQISICDPLQFVYVVKNPGTGDLTAFTIRDQLPEGIQTESGKQDLEFRLEDGLKAGETRQFVAELVATRAGSFSSRAVATAADGELETRSQAPQTKVVEAGLAVAIDGERRVYGRQVVNYTARISNTGNAPAENVQIQLALPDRARVVGISELRTSDNQVQQSGQQGQPTPADVQEASRKNQQSGSQNQQSGSQNQQSGSQNQNAGDNNLQMVSEDLVIDRLDPGQTIAFDFAVRPNGLEEIKAQLVALNRCAGDRDRDQAAARSVAMTTTKVVLLPDLLVSLVDNEGTVPQGGELTYFLTVRNQGDAPAKNIEASAELPKELEFVSADGPTQGEANGSKVNFDAVEQIEPGQQIRWTIRAKATGAGEVRVNADVKSADLERPVRTEEPTVVYSEDEGPQGRNPQGRNQQGQNQQGQGQQEQGQQEQGQQEQGQQGQNQQSDN